jgi:apolipoprotein N-acyltransferase
VSFTARPCGVPGLERWADPRAQLEAGPARETGGVARWLPRLLAALAGGVPALAFPEPGWWWLAWVGLVPLVLLVRAAGSPGEAAVRAWLGGAGFLLAVHHWLLPSVHVFLPVVVLALGLLWLPLGWLTWRLLHGRVTVRRLAAALAAVPAGWVLVEVARSVEFFGGPWGLLGTSQWQQAPALSLAALGGVWLVSAAVAAVNVAVAAACIPGAARGVRPAAAGAVAVGVTAALGWHTAWPGPDGGSGTVRVLAVQPGTLERAGARLDRQVALTRSAAALGPDLVVWGESSVGVSLLERPELQARLAALADEVDAPLLVNVDAREPGGGITKTAALVETAGVTGSYAKTRLVPFGEYVPLRPALSWLARMSDVAAEDRRRGPGPVVLDTGGAAVGPLVCFESAFPDMTRALVGRGAQLVVVQSSTWTFQDSWAPEQHASLAAVRAAESGVPVLHATLTGQSAAYDRRGRPLAEPLGTDRTGVLVVDVALGGGGTPYARSGPWVPVLAVVTLLAVAADATATTYGGRHGVRGGEDRRAVARGARPGGVPGAAQGGHGTAVEREVRRDQGRGRLPLPGLPGRAVPQRDQVRLALRLALVLRAARRGPGGVRRGPCPRYAPGGGALRPVRLPPRARLRR